MLRQTGRIRRRHPPAPRRQACARRGFSLFEVVIALAIFAASIAAIGQLVSSGVRGAVHARLQTQAVMRCESKMAELVAGIATLTSSGGTAFPDDPNWKYTVALLPGPHSDLYLVELNVTYTGAGERSSTSYSIRRLIRDPQVVVQMELAKEQAQEEQAAQKAASSSTSQSSSAGGASGSSGGSKSSGGSR